MGRQAHKLQVEGTYRCRCCRHEFEVNYYIQGYVKKVIIACMLSEDFTCDI